MNQISYDLAMYRLHIYKIISPAGRTESYPPLYGT